jgi:hypothetical protein
MRDNGYSTAASWLNFAPSVASSTHLPPQTSANLPGSVRVVIPERRLVAEKCVINLTTHY